MTFTELMRRFVKRAPKEPCGCGRDERMVPLWTAEDEVRLAERIVRAQESRRDA